MDRRLAIAISGTSAAMVLAVGLTAAGFVPGPRASVEAETPASAADPGEFGETAAIAALEPEVVYIKPADKPKTIVVKRPATSVRSASASRSQKTVARKAAARTRRAARIAQQRHEHESEAREHARERAAERRKEAREHEREREDEREDD